jgi:hypothetical protein
MIYRIFSFFPTHEYLKAQKVLKGRYALRKIVLSLFNLYEIPYVRK